MGVGCVYTWGLGKGAHEQRRHVKNGKRPHQPMEPIYVEQNRQEWQQIFVCLSYEMPMNLQLLMRKYPESIDIYIYIAHAKFLQNKLVLIVDRTINSISSRSDKKTKENEINLIISYQRKCIICTKC